MEKWGRPVPIPILGLVGPTASGKTELSLSIAHKLGQTEILYADSMAIYKYLDIGTAKPTLEQRMLVPHHLIDLLEPTERWSSHSFRTEAMRIFADLSARHSIPLIVGGTGFYLKSLYQPAVAQGSPINQRLRLVLDRMANCQLFARVNDIDPPRARKIGKNDRKRLIRALEIYHQTGIPPSAFEKKSIGHHPSYRFILVGLSLSRDDLKKRISERTGKMLTDGLIQETQRLIDKGFSYDIPAFKNFTYQPVVQYLQGQITMNKLEELITTGTNQYLKRQQTWFRKAPIHWVTSEGKSHDSISDEIIGWYYKMTSGG